MTSEQRIPNMLVFDNADAYFNSEWVTVIMADHDLSNENAQVFGISAIRTILGGRVLEKDLSPVSTEMFVKMGFREPLDRLYIISRLADIVLRDDARKKGKSPLLPMVMDPNNPLENGGLSLNDYVLAQKNVGVHVSPRRQEPNRSQGETEKYPYGGGDFDFYQTPMGKASIEQQAKKHAATMKDSSGKGDAPIAQMTKEHNREPEVTSRENPARTYGEREESTAEGRLEAGFRVLNEKLSGGMKVSDLHGGNGIPCRVVPDDEMPPVDDGNDAEIIIGQDAIDKRINGEVFNELRDRMPSFPKRPKLVEGDTWVADAPACQEGAWLEFAAKTSEGHHVNYRVSIETGELDRVVHDGQFNLDRPALRFTTEKWVGKAGVVNGLVQHTSVDEQTNKRFHYTCRHDGKLLYVNNVPKPELKGV